MNLAKQLDTKSILRNKGQFIHQISNKYQKQKLGKNLIYYSNKKHKVPMNKLNQGGKRPVLRILKNIKERN